VPLSLARLQAPRSRATRRHRPENFDSVTSRHAFAALAAPYRYRVGFDVEGWPMVPCKLGRLGWHDGRAIAIYTDDPRLFARLWAVPGRPALAGGDQEGRALVAVDRLPEVATLIQAPRRRPATSAAHLQRVPDPTYRATSADWEPLVAGGRRCDTGSAAGPALPIRLVLGAGAR
jgi:hypothetical protein